MSDSEGELENDGEASVPTLLTDEMTGEGGRKSGLGAGSSSSTWYRYKDYAVVQEDQPEFVEKMPTALSAARGAGESSIRVQKFPVKLYVILAQKEFKDIITWMPHGRAWKVLKYVLYNQVFADRQCCFAHFFMRKYESRPISRFL